MSTIVLTSREDGHSDLDLIVEFDRPTGMMAFVHLKYLISDRLNIKIDLVS
ncbi:MAG: hypothetical protein ABFC71_01590 [Methanoregula sp.]